MIYQIPVGANTPTNSGEVYALPSVPVKIVGGGGLEISTAYAGPFTAYVAGTVQKGGWIRPTFNTVVLIQKSCLGG